jgi:hypothetical protein
MMAIEIAEPDDAVGEGRADEGGVEVSEKI